MTADPAASSPALQTPRLRLRLPAIADGAFFLELLNDPFFVRFTGDRGIRDLAGAQGYVTDRLLPTYATHGFTLLLVERRSDGIPLGICGLVQRTYLDAPDLGFGFLARHCRQGYGYESATAVMADARKHLRLQKIYGLTSEDNLGSLRLLQKLGFKIEAHEQFPGLDHLSVVLVNAPLNRPAPARDSS